MLRKVGWMQIGAYALLALAVAATALAFAVLQAWDSPVIPGAGAGYRYMALGYQRANGDDFASLDSITLEQLLSKVPSSYRIGMEFSQNFGWGVRPAKYLPTMRTGLVFGDYLQALHLHPLAGRLIDLQDQQKGAQVIVLSDPLALQWFGSAQAAIGRSVYDTHGWQLRVVGVLPSAFRGTETLTNAKPTVAWVPGTLLLPISSGRWPFSKGVKPKGDLLAMIPLTGPAPLLSVPQVVSQLELDTVLARLYLQVHRFLPHGLTGFVVADPYSIGPIQQREYAHRMRLFLDLALAALMLAAINVLVLNWLHYLRRRATLQLERVLGARRGYLLRRFALRTLATLLILLLACALLIAGGVLLLRHLSGTLGPVLTLRALAAPLAWLLPLILGVIVLAQAVPMMVLLARERLDGARTVLGSRGDQRFGMPLLLGEIALGAIMSVIAAWAVTFAWRSTHQNIGFLDRSATIITLHRTGGFANFSIAEGAKAQLLLGGALQALSSLVPRAIVGAGPAIVPDTGYDLPKNFSASTRNANACVVEATPGWIAASGMRIEAGQSFDAAHATPNQVLLDERLAAKLFGLPDAALGREVTESGELKSLRVIGVLAPVYLHGDTRDICPVLVTDMRNSSFALLGGEHTLIVGRDLDAAQRTALRQRLVDLFHGQHAKLNVGSIRSPLQMRDWLAAAQILQARIFVVIALFAWAIALSGVMAVLRLYLTQRRRLNAIHSALGASPTHIYRSVVLGTLALALLGTLIAALGLPWLAQQYALLSDAQVAPFGPATWIALTVLLLAVFLVAHFPARRAARAEPAASLHEL